MIAVFSASLLAGCTQHQSAPVVNAPVTTTQPQATDAKSKGWFGRTADATWDVVKEPADWFKAPPKKQASSPTTQAAEPTQPVEIIITPRNPGVIVTDTPSTTEPNR